MVEGPGQTWKLFHAAFRIFVLIERVWMISKFIVNNKKSNKYRVLLYLCDQLHGGESFWSRLVIRKLWSGLTQPEITLLKV